MQSPSSHDHKRPVEISTEDFRAQTVTPEAASNRPVPEDALAVPDLGEPTEGRAYKGMIMASNDYFRSDIQKKITRTEARAVECPNCGSPAGQKCIGARDKIRESNHMERVHAALVGRAMDTTLIKA